MPRKKKIEVEEVVPVEEISQEQSSSDVKEELTDEQKKKAQEFVDALIKKRLHPRVVDLYKYLIFTKKTLDEVYHDLINKKCGLSKLNRNFLESFERSLIEELLTEHIKYIKHNAS